MVSNLQTKTLPQDSDLADPTFSALIAGPPGGGRGERRGGGERQEARPESQVARAEPRHSGVAFGLDYVGTFRHHTGTLGPFGFYGGHQPDWSTLIGPAPTLLRSHWSRASQCCWRQQF